MVRQDTQDTDVQCTHMQNTWPGMSTWLDIFFFTGQEILIQTVNFQTIAQVVK